MRSRFAPGTRYPGRNAHSCCHRMAGLMRGSHLGFYIGTTLLVMLSVTKSEVLAPKWEHATEERTERLTVLL